MGVTWFKEPKYAWVGLGSLWIIGFISMSWSASMLIAALCTPLGGWLVDRYGPKRVMLISAVMSILGTGIVVLGHHSTSFFIGYGVISGLAGIGLTTTYILMFEWFHHHRAKAVALLTSAEVENHDKLDTVAPTLKRSSHLPILILVAIAFFTCGINMGSVEMNLVAIHQLASVSPSMIALSMSILGIMEIAGSFIFGFFLDRFNKLAMMTLLYSIRIMGFAFLFMHVGWSPVLFAIAFGITYLSAIPGGLLIVNEFTKGNGKQTGFLLFFHQGGAIFGALIGGLSFDYFKNYQVLIVVDVVSETNLPTSQYESLCLRNQE